MSPTAQWLDLTEAAEYLGCSKITLRRWISAGSPPAYRTPAGRGIRLKQRDLDLLLESHRIPSARAAG